MDSDGAAGYAPAEFAPQKQSAFRIPAHVRTTHSADGGTVLDIDHGQIYRLNFAAAKILELVKQGLPEPAIAEQLMQVFGIERSVAGRDVREFLRTLERHHLLTAQRDSLT
jgi:hypothetical protein